MRNYGFGIPLNYYFFTCSIYILHYMFLYDFGRQKIVKRKNWKTYNVPAITAVVSLLKLYLKKRHSITKISTTTPLFNPNNHTFELMLRVKHQT